MDSESPLPSKRLRVSLNGNLHMTECVREFKLPRQFPSMVTKVSSEASNDKNKVRPNFNTAVTCLPKTPIHTKIVANQEIPGPSFIRKIKIKGKDGRDLGELNVQDLPQNIQGKTITLAKNGIIKPPEIITPDKSKGITIGVLTPINILKSEKPFVTSSSSIPCVNKDQKESKDIGKDSKKPMIIAQQQINDNKKPIIIAQQQINDNKKPIIIAQQQINDSKKPIIIEQKQMSAVMDPQGRPQVLVFQSGKNWHMVKLSTTAPVNGSQNGKNIVLEKLPSLPNCGKATILQVKDQSQNVVAKESFQNGSDTLPVGSKISSTNCSNTSTKRWPMWEAEKNPTERCKKKFPIVATENGEFRPKIEISRVFGPSGSKLVSSKHMTSQIQTADKLPLENMNSPTSARNSPRNNASLKQDEMVVLPSDIPDSMDSDSELSTVIKDAQPINTKISDKSMLKIGKCTETAKYPATRDLFSARKDTKKLPGDGEKKDEISNRLNILTKALSTVEDKELRAKALKALADCGIGMEKLVPICPPSEMRPVKDSGTQTPVFGVIEPDHFVYVNQENPELERIRPIERKAPQKIGHIIGNPHPQELSLNTFDLPNWVTPNACDELGEMVKAYVGESEGVSEVRNILAEKPNQVSPELVSQLLVDFQTYKTFDENGLLSIHRAVINDDLRAVSRLLTIFREESPDIPTADGQTSLELAIRYEVSPKIITMLLQAGAEPTSPEIGHDSALIIASKKSLPILKELIPYVTTRKSIDNYDSSGFAALHYCAQNDNKSGVIELTNASADVNVRDRRSGRTPLFHAIENEHIELAQLLLDKGAQANIASYSGHTVFALVEEGKHYSLAESLNRIGK